MGLYVGSFLTYETSSFLIFVVPLLVWPVHRALFRPAFRSRLSDQALRGDPGRVCRGGGAQISLPERRSGGAQFSIAALRVAVVISCVASVLSARTVHVHVCGPMGASGGLLVVLGTAGLFLFSSRGRSAAQVAAGGRFEPGSQWYLVVLGGGDSGSRDAAVPACRVRKFQLHDWSRH